MNLSRYTVVTEGAADETLLFNTATGAFAVVSGVGLDEVADEIARAGFATDRAPHEELAAQRAAFDAARDDPDELVLSLIPTYACNYRCPYCYEMGHDKPRGKMGRPVMDAIMGLIARVHGESPLRRLSVQWYGGDPSLALDVVEELSGLLMGWCDNHQVAYDAMMLTNANLIGDAEADLVARCRISSALLTIDGPEQVHNQRRVAADGSNSYRTNIEAARRLRARGVQVSAGMNADRVTLPLYGGLRERLLREEGIDLALNKLNDYGGTFGAGTFARPDFDLLTHEEFFELQAAQLLDGGCDAAGLQALLAPVPRFCNGQRNRYFVIDLVGDVYDCDGWVGDRAYARFNVLDDPATWRMGGITFDATRDEECGACELLPICQGSCRWERLCCAASEGAMPCHPLKTTLPAYLRAWRDQVIGDGEGASPFRLVAEGNGRR
ncbi:MAG: SPASM domain-containing protein [Eggerthellaceae bacterium]|nr:SPASM domain-containing protein [Eggerthellaceae bacterium]